MQAIVVGGSGGIGNAFVQYLNEHSGFDIISTYSRHQPETKIPSVNYQQLDITDESAVESFCKAIDDLGLFINAAGFLHTNQFSPEKSTRHINKDYFMESMAINALPTLMFSRYLASKFRHKQPAVFATVSARVGSIEENHLGGWYSYRASKAALNQVLKTLSIEWRRNLPNVCVAALHPGTIDTGLSRPFQKNVPEGQLFTAEQSVSYMMNVIETLKPELTGKFWSFDGSGLPW
jgi:NAD(P)-dependent dehydrogenase (short-subunit alcohol dehydrogenase family)